MKYRLAIFDMDGTILDTLGDLTDATNHILSEAGFPERSIEEIRMFVGNGLHKLLERAVPEGTDAKEIDRLFEIFVPYYRAHCAIKTGPYPGITETIRAVREAGLLTAVVSNKADSAVKELCKTYFNGLFDIEIGDRPGMNRKPAPDSVYEVLKALNIEKADAIYIGDSDVDLLTAKNSGLSCIACAYGFRGRQFLENNGASIIVDSPEEIAEILVKA